MERVGEWRMIEAEAVDGEGRPADTAKPNTEVTKPLDTRPLIAAVAAVVLALAGVAIWATLPQGGVKLDLAAGQDLQLTPVTSPPATGAVSATAFVVDVEGAVVDPGVHQVATGGRVSDAIAAAGGYSADVDIAAAASGLNLAEHVTDGQKIHVPARGEVVSVPAGATAVPGGAAAGPIDINHASESELESLPGIGPVTAAKIIAARPFATIDELDSRGVVGPSTMDEIRDLISVTP